MLTVSRKLDRRIKPQDFAHARALYFRKRLLRILRASDALKGHPLEQVQLPFDRFLLHRSPTYRRLKALGRELGLPFVPGVASGAYRQAFFDPRATGVEFLPLERELRWVCGQRLAPGELTATFNRLRFFSTAFAHEALHVALFRLLHPTGRGWAERARLAFYFNLVEAIVLLTEWRIVTELGEDSRPLHFMGVFYRAADSGASVRALDLEAFRSLVCRFVWALEGRVDLDAMEREFAELGRCFSVFPGTSVSRVFREVTAPSWVDHFVRERPRLRRWFHSEEGHPARLRLSWNHGSASDLLRDEAGFRRLYEWYVGLFPASVR